MFARRNEKRLSKGFCAVYHNLHFVLSRSSPDRVVCGLFDVSSAFVCFLFDGLDAVCSVIDTDGDVLLHVISE